QARAGQRAEKRRQRRPYLEEAEPHNDDRHQRRHRRKQRKPPRPGGKAGNGLRLIGRGKPAGHRVRSIDAEKTSRVKTRACGEYKAKMELQENSRAPSPTSVCRAISRR